MRNVTYIVSNINKALAFEWIVDNVDTSRFRLSFILFNTADSSLEHFLKERKIPTKRIAYRGKKDLLKAVWRTLTFLRAFKPDVIHTHLFEASLVGLFVGKLLGIKKRLYTRHHATFHQVYFPRAVYYDKMISRLATDVVAISQNVQKVLTQQEKVPNKKVHLVHHGFDLAAFENIPEARIDLVRKHHQLYDAFPVIGVIARQTQLKGIQYIIPAFKRLLEDYPKAHLVLANAQGTYKATIDQHLATLPEGHFTEIIFENDLASLYQLFDVYVHVPIDPQLEAFGQTYVEALAAGIPSVFTLSGVATEFIQHEYNALVVDYKNEAQIYEAIQRLLSDKVFAQQLIKNGKESVKALFSLKMMIQKLENLYA
ncbi:MAG: glycosyltransferase family 4 protein [Thermonemataceae bacterium]